METDRVHTALRYYRLYTQCWPYEPHGTPEDKGLAVALKAQGLIGHDRILNHQSVLNSPRRLAR